MKKQKSFEDYLKGLSKAELIEIYKVKTGATKSAGCCGQEPIGEPPTPNGHWHCKPDCTWQWIPEIG